MAANLKKHSRYVNLLAHTGARCETFTSSALIIQQVTLCLYMPQRLAYMFYLGIGSHASDEKVAVFA
eukprot:scaffold81729_cov20-Prasinocladus_malaysianus.AAC.2